jgi:two-component system invasion response regulator UvrY
MISVLIVDDHPIVRRGLKEILKGEPDVEVAETADGREALRLIRQQAFDLVVLDLDLPGTNGLDVLKDIKREHRGLHVLVLSVYPEDQFAVRVLKAGASGFLSKDAAPDELVKAIRKILAGGKHISGRIAEQLLEHLSDKPDSSLHDKLSDREFQVLCLFGSGKTAKQIAEELCLSPPTVSTYRARILDKMNLKTTADLIRYAIEHRIASPK